jgi:hypothetical protein
MSGRMPTATLRRPGLAIRAAAISLAALFAAFGLDGCLAGSETGNPAKGLTGQIRTLDGLPAARTRVVLVPVGFVPADAHATASLPAATTDAQGRYAFGAVALGRYNLEAMNPSDGTRARLAGIDAGDSTRELAAQTLGMPGSIAATLGGASDTVNGFIYLPGSTFRAAVGASAGVVRLDSLPPGRIDSVVYGSAAAGAAPARAFAWNLQVQPATVSPASGPFLAWRRFASLIVDGGPTGVKLSADVAGIPVRIALPDSILAAAAKDGSDLRVANERGDALPCEVQSQGGSPVALWVRMDTVYAGKPTRIRLYWNYGGKDPLTVAKAGTVFSSTDGFAGAWHLDEDPAAGNGRISDATGQGNDGISVGYSAAGATEAGVAGNALKFDGKTQFMGTPRAFDDPESFTVLIWFRAGHTQGGRIFEFADSDTGSATYWDRLLHIYPDGTLHYGVFPPDSAGKPPTTRSSYKILGTSKAYDDGAWHQAAVRLSPDSGQTLFVDGSRIGNDPATRTAQIIKGYWKLGWGYLSAWAPAGSGEYFQGSLDEFWVVHAALGDDFVKLSYENLKPGSRLIRWP